MRALTVLLLTANLVLAAWQFWFTGPVETPEPPPLDAQPLVLAHELPVSMPPLQAGDAESVPGPAARTADGPGQVPDFDPLELTCQALGPFLDRTAAGRARAQLADAGLRPELRETEILHRLGYWVFIPPVAERADAEPHIERLRESGIRDFYLVAEGDNENAISLGVFGTREAAEQHASRLRGLGFDIEVGERRRLVPAWWLDFLAPPPGSPGAERVAELVLDAEDALGLDARPCR